MKTLISCGSDVDEYRNLAQDTLKRVSQMWVNELAIDLHLLDWDFRVDNPRTESQGELSRRSLEIAEDVDLVIAILGSRVPEITKKEVLVAARRIFQHESVELKMFVNPSQLAAEHQELLDLIEDEFGISVVYAHYVSELSFQATLLTTLFTYGFGALGFRVAQVPEVRA